MWYLYNLKKVFWYIVLDEKCFDMDEDFMLDYYVIGILLSNWEIFRKWDMM